jgi:hypothetical protein
VNPKVVSEMLGHASVSITLDIYSHVLPDMQHDAAETMGKILYGWAQKDTNCCQNCCQEGSDREKRLQAQQPETASIPPILGAGGTGIEPATGGFGALGAVSSPGRCNLKLLLNSGFPQFFV